MKPSILHLIAVALIVAAATGCQSPASHFYTLNATAQGSGTNDIHGTVLVGPVTVPAEVDRPQITLQMNPNQLAIDEFHRWVEPLNDAIGQAVAGDLSALLGTSRVTTSRVANIEPTYRVTINVQRFESVPGKRVLVEALWVVRKADDQATLSGHTLATETVKGKSFDQLAAAHSRALEKVSRDIAAVIRAEARDKP